MVFATPSLRAQAFPAPAYKSPYGPKYFYQSHVAGITTKTLFRTGIKSGMFGGVALFGVIFFASGIPKLQEDILQKIPFIGHRFIKEIPASDNPF
ncbi:ubiquinol-cytochrome-c reductase complex subunit-domain-containing protein [Chaetomidium leptoderma]|uniref:Ubiquinol-cytochrome-c reductase complex subunit-domain-containing protein n=1 Tax=Chaetomidium leptoderma TaxID=669021 RepID=A0AAN6VRB9_9PEZI|nr:ubiquinol-cytochrome-c reductase complex subunit-domain-containing protein [Chaetomidium leptoderma]